MSEFTEVMRNWRRMCKAYTTDDESCCDGCPVVDFHEHGCGAIFEMEDSTDWQKYADTIREWAAEHPEPVYPTWIEWLVDIGVIGEYAKLPLEASSTVVVSTTLAEPIPADIAQKLGIEPKEG